MRWASSWASTVSSWPADSSRVRAVGRMRVGLPRPPQTIGGTGDKIYASLVAADGKIYGVTRMDGTVVLALAPKFQELGRNHLGDASIFNATPAIDDGQLLLRSDKALYCIGK